MAFVLFLCVLVASAGLYVAVKHDRRIGISIIVIALTVSVAQLVIGTGGESDGPGPGPDGPVTTTTPATKKETTTTTEKETTTTEKETTKKQNTWELYEGQVIKYGKFSVDGVIKNGDEDLEWIVLSVEGDKALLITKYIIDNRMYADTPTATWSSCRLRTWLNGDFYDDAFTTSEKSRILLTDLPSDANHKSGTPGGASTRDRVFLLSATEVKYYWGSAGDRVAMPTDHAVACGAWPAGYWWWTRTPGRIDSKASYIKSSGEVNNEGGTVYGEGGVRPAMYVDLT